MPRIKEGFKGERAIVLPDFLIEELKRDPLGRELHITDIGYYPHASFHYRERSAEEVNEFVLIYCVEGEGWFELDHQRYKITFLFFPNTRLTLMVVMPPIHGQFIGYILMGIKQHSLV